MSPDSPIGAREHLIREFRRIMVGPGAPDELLPNRPSETYICGRLWPRGCRLGQEQDDELQEGSDGPAEGVPALVNAPLPSAMGMTFALRPGCTRFRLRLAAAVYRPIETCGVQPTDDGPSAGSDAGAPPGSCVPGGLLALPDDPEESHEAEGETPEQASDPAQAEPGEEKASGTWIQWQRHGCERTIAVDISVPPADHFPWEADSTPLARLELAIQPHHSNPGRPRLVTVSLVNRNEAPSRGLLDEWMVFQPVIEALGDAGTESESFMEPPMAGVDTSDPDHGQHLLLYRTARSFATGHGCAVEWVTPRTGSQWATSLSTSFIPRAQVKGLTYELPEEYWPEGLQDTFRMRNLAGDASDEWILDRLRQFCDVYQAWMRDRREAIPDALSELRDPSTRDAAARAAHANLEEAGPQVLARMRAGVAALEEDARVFHCFRLTNEVMFRQARQAAWARAQRGRVQASAWDEVEGHDPSWRPFQLAFLLMSMRGITDPAARTGTSASTERGIMDLIWFPTGGGKTEAYLGLAAFVLLYRRLRHEDPRDGGGVGVITRYTLRLLTTQQFERATRLVCALEAIRERGVDLRGTPADLGDERFTIGLWIGGDSAPNRFRDSGDRPGAFQILKDLKDGKEASFADVRHLRECPWCGSQIVVNHMRICDAGGRTMLRKQQIRDGGNYRLVVPCSGGDVSPTGDKCTFDGDGGIPILMVDDEIYDHPPSILIGTVDKFARFAWEPRASAFLGDWPEAGRRRPPDLVIQDELHLISGPLGTMVGLFEGAFDLTMLSRGQLPKIVGSTATIRRAREQVLGLFDRRTLVQFPPPALTAGDSFFATTDFEDPGRVYLGAMAPGTSGKLFLLRSMGALLQLVSELPEEVRDPYWTLLGYFNSTRELAGGSVLVLDDVPAYIRNLRRIRSAQGNPAPARELRHIEEMTGRRKASEISEVLKKIEQVYRGGSADAVDVLLATNMVSVGVDVDRLGLMLVQGQPKTTSEYIQASSRVGRRSSSGPGLIVTLAGWTRSRDRSHYERFVPYHEAFYRDVEATSVTPWAPQARKRALGAVLVTLLRHTSPDLLRDPRAYARLEDSLVDSVVEALGERAESQDPAEAVVVRETVRMYLGQWRDWASLHEDDGEYGVGMPWGGGDHLLLRDPTAEADKGRVPVPHSMRTVEAEAAFILWPPGRSTGHAAGEGTRGPTGREGARGEQA